MCDLRQTPVRQECRVKKKPNNADFIPNYRFFPLIRSGGFMEGPFVDPYEVDHRRYACGQLTDGRCVYCELR